jgi:hypothetical protein
MTLKDALKRIEELERKVRELEARPAQVFEYHYHQPAPAYAPQYPQYPYQPYPWQPYITWGAGSSLQGQGALTFNAGN